MALMDDAGRKLVGEAVTEAESTTSGEIVTVLADCSDGYTDVALLWAVGAAFTAMSVFAAFPKPFLDTWDSLIGGWGWTGLAYALAGLACGVVGVVPSVMVGLFPPAIRVSGISFTYNVAYALWASTTPLLLIALMPWSPWVCVGFCLIMGAVGLLTALYFGRREPLVFAAEPMPVMCGDK